MKPDPSKSILNPMWKYTSAAHTDLEATYKRIKKEMLEASKSKVVPLRKEK